MYNGDFDNQFKDVQKNMSRVFKGAIVLALIQAALGLAVIGGLVYVIVHFLSKIW